jgi:MFS-type transporter involved in bile tolerance (Atg22 family)
MSYLAFNTTTSVAILFAKTTLQMSSSKTIVVGVLTQFTAIWSASLTPYTQRKLGVSAKPLLISSIAGVALMCIWGLVSIRSEREMYIAAVWFGLVSDGRSAFSANLS